MYCKNCGNQMDDMAVVCLKCGAAKGTGAGFCPNCGGAAMPGACVCTKCGAALHTPANQPFTNAFVSGGPKSKLAAGLLGIFLGSFGVHNFYLGYTNKALTQLMISVGGLALSILTCGVSAIAATAMGIWGLVEGIQILTGTIQTDAAGQPLKD